MTGRLHPGDADPRLRDARPRRLSQHFRPRERHGSVGGVGGRDRVAFRLAHLDDPHAHAVIETAAETFGWTPPATPGELWGVAFARNKNLGAYAAMAIKRDADTGAIRVARVVAAIDSGQAVTPNGPRNQIEGGIIQSPRWTRFERVSFDRHTSQNWSRYPIPRFSAGPDSVTVRVGDGRAAHRDPTHCETRPARSQAVGRQASRARRRAALSQRSQARPIWPSLASDAASASASLR